MCSVKKTSELIHQGKDVLKIISSIRNDFRYLYRQDYYVKMHIDRESL